MRVAGVGAVPNGNDGAPPGGWGSEISTSIPQESQQITQGRAHVLLQPLGVGCGESFPNPEAMTCQEWGARLPWAGGCGHSPLTAPGAAGKLVKHPQGGGASRGSWVHRSQADFAGDNQESACWLCFPDDLGTARAASGLTDHDSWSRGVPQRGWDPHLGHRGGVWALKE